MPSGAGHKNYATCYYPVPGAVVQSAAPKDQLARVLSIYQLGFMAGAPIGAFFMGIAVDVFGPHKIAFVPALGMGIIVVWMAVASPIWNLKADR